MDMLTRLCCKGTRKRCLLLFVVLYLIFAIALVRNSNNFDDSLPLVENNYEIVSRKNGYPSNHISPIKEAAKSPAKEVVQIKPTSKQADYLQPKNLSSKLLTQEKSPDTLCKSLPKPTFLEPGKKPLTALHSFPGSGNTWMRVLLSSLTGYNTGDIYKDGAFAKTPGFSYRKDDTVVAVKTHHPFWDDFNGADPAAPAGRYWERAILIVRHPLDATISVFNFFGTHGSHTKVAKLEKFLLPDGKPNKSWEKFAHDQIRNWGRCLEYWINIFKGKILIIFYEDLKVDLKRQLININNFLGLPLDETRLNCTIESNMQQKFHRNQNIDKRILYDTSMLNEVEVVLDNVKILLTTNYTHIDETFSMPASYASNLIRENFSVKPDSEKHP